MSSITAQQAKLDLELVLKEKRLEIGKCNGRINPGKTQREPTFQVILDALALTPCYSVFLTTADVLEVYMHHFLGYYPQIFPRVHGQNFDELPIDEVIVSFFKELNHTREINSIIDVVVDQMHQPWRTFATLINRSLSGKTFGLDKIRLSRAQILWGMYYKKNVDYVELLWEDSTYQIDNRGHKKQEKIPEMRENKAYKTYLSYATRVIPLKKIRKFKKPASPKLTTIPVSPEEPTRKSKRVKRPAMKPTNAPTAGVVIRDTHVMSLSKKKEKMTVEKRKGIDFLSKVALIEEAQYEEVHKKSLRDFHKTHLSGFGIVTSAAKIIPSVTNKGTGAKPRVPDVTEEESTKSEAESWGRDEDDSNNDHVSRSEGSDQESNSGDDNPNLTKKKGWIPSMKLMRMKRVPNLIKRRMKKMLKMMKQKRMTGLLKPRPTILMMKMKPMLNRRLKIMLKEGTDAEMINVQQGNEILEITLNQVIEDAHVTISTITKKTEVTVTSSSHSSDLASFLNFSDIPHTDAEIVSPMDVHVHHEVPSKQTPILLTVPILVITDSSPVYSTVIPQSLQSFTPPPPQSTLTLPPRLKTRRHKRVTTLEKEVDELKRNDPINT
ncbi:hypothetical protein Tco_0855951, partial [Tanacetum coccineum]